MGDSCAKVVTNTAEFTVLNGREQDHDSVICQSILTLFRAISSLCHDLVKTEVKTEEVNEGLTRAITLSSISLYTRTVRGWFVHSSLLIHYDAIKSISQSDQIAAIPRRH